MSYFISTTKYLLQLSFIFLLGHPCQAFFGKYLIQNFTPRDYKAGIQNIDFAQNKDMTLFVANNLGVLSYNGTEWETHAFRTGKKKRSLAFDENANRLYVGSQGDFGFFEKDWKYVSLAEKIPVPLQDFDEVWDVFIVNATVYFCTFQGIFVYDGQSISVIESEGGFNRSFLVNGKLFTQNQQGKLVEIKDSKLTASYQQNETNQIITGIIPQTAGYLLFYNSGKIEFSNSFQAEQKYTDFAEALNGTYVNHVLQLSDTRLVISTQTAGIFLFDLQNQTYENISVEDGLQTNACLRSFQDYAGNLWVGMQNGIALIYINSPVRLINQKVNIQGSGYDAFENDDGTYYTTSNGIYYLAKNMGQCVFLEGTEGPAYGMQKINGKLYAGHHTGLFLLERGKAKYIASTDGLWKITQLRTNPEYAIGGTYSGLHLFKLNGNGQLTAVQKIDGFDESSRFFEEDQKGRIWVGQFYKGLYLVTLTQDFTKANIKNISNEYDLPIQEQIILCTIKDDLYLATKAGVYRIDQTTDRIEEAEIFADVIGKQQVYLLVEGRMKNVHVYTDNLVGFFKQFSKNNYVFIPSSLFQLRYSFNNDLLNVSVNTDNGILYTANEGFIHYNPDLEDPVPIEMPLIVNKIYSVSEDSTLYEREVFEGIPKTTPSIVASHRAKVLQFHVESFQFKEVHNHQFRYFLKGFDEDYGEWTNSPTKEYTNLQEGQYEFYPQKLNYYGEIVTGQPVTLIVKPPFYKSLFAKVFYVIAGLLILFIAFVLQRSKYKRRTAKIEETKQLEIVEKKQEVLKLKEEKMADELRHVSNLLAASTMNLVVKNEFIEKIKEELEHVRQNRKPSDTTKALEKLVKDIDSTLRVQDDWEQFEYHFDRVHGDFLQRMREEFRDLTPSEQKLCAFLRLNMNTKEIANLMSISLRGVEVARYRLRKKLGLNKSQNLSKFLLEY